MHILVHVCVYTCVLTLMSIECCDESKVGHVQLEHSDCSSIVSHKGILVGGVICTQVSQGYNCMRCATKYRTFTCRACIQE